MSDPRQPRALSLLRPERALAFLIALQAVIGAWDLSKRPGCIDYYQFWVVGRAVLAGETDALYTDAERERLGRLYYERAVAEAAAQTPPGARASAGPGAVVPTKRLHAASRRQVLETYSTPWLYTLFGLFSRADYDASQTDFQLASLFGYLLAIVLLARLSRFPSAATFLAAAALLGPFHPFLDDTIAGNVNRLQLLALAVVLYLGAQGRFRGRHLAAGAVLGAALLFKPNLGAAAVVLFVGWAFAGERGRLVATLAGVLVGSAASVAASAAFFGSLAPWGVWLGELPALMAAGSPAAGSADEGNLSLARLLFDRLGISVGPGIAVLGLAAVAAALFVARRRGGARALDTDPGARDALLLGTGAAVSLLSSELSWQHYFVALVPLALALLRPGAPDGGSRLPLALAGLLGLALVSFQSVGSLLGPPTPLLLASVVASGTLLLLLAGVTDLAVGGRKTPV